MVPSVSPTVRKSALIFETLRRAREYIFGRQRAYMFVFNKEAPGTRLVLADLARFCRATESTFHPDPRVHAMIEGRREVWLRIQNHLNLDQNELYKLVEQGKGG